MTGSLEITTLGQVSITLDNVPLEDLPHKAKALLIYLACTGEPQPRPTLVGLLWPEHGEKQAMTSLRVALTHLRKAVGSYLTITRQSVAINQSSPYQVDLLALENGLSLVQRPWTESDMQSMLQLDEMSQTLVHYQGDFLAGFMVSDSQAFEEWVTLERERLRVQVIGSLQSLVAGYMTLGRYQEGLAEAARLVQLDPLREESHRQLMRLFAHSGQRSAALQQYETCRQILAKELGVEPTAQTVALYEQIRSGIIAGPQQEAGTDPPLIRGRLGGGELLSPALPQQDWGDAPDVSFFYGRRAELASLSSWLVTDRCRLVAILGMGGQGKTALAAKLVHEVADQFEYVIWRSLLNAPPFSDIIHTWLQFLSAQAMTHLPESQDEQVNLLFDFLRQKHCLLILDNAESILLSGARAGDYRAGYEEFDQFIRRVGESDHQSCLLLTSREKPRTFTRLQRRKNQVRSLALSGVGMDTGQKILQMETLSGSSDEVNQLINCYSGNPLALMLVADTIDDLFAGDIATFLAAESFIFEDIQDVLDQQFGRLSELEQEILFWLAIEREACAPQALKANLVHSADQRTFLSTLRSLQRRSLIQQQSDQFFLQNVILEYTTERFISLVCQALAANELTLLHQYALIKAQAKAYVRESQIRLILQPIAQWLLDSFGEIKIEDKLHELLNLARQFALRQVSYAGGNILNLLLHLAIDAQPYDFSQLAVRQAYLRGKLVAAVNFSESDLTDSVFTESFGLIFTVSFSTDGQILAAGTETGEVRLWRLNGDQPTHVLKGHTGYIWSIEFSPDGSMLASASSDKTICLWEIATGQLLDTIDTLNGIVWSIAFSADGQYLAGSGYDETIYLWHVQTREVYKTITLAGDRIVTVAFSPHDCLLACGGQAQTVYLWDVEQDVVRYTLSDHSGVVKKIAFSPDGHLLATGSYDQSVRLWRVQDGQSYQTFDDFDGRIRSLAFNGDGTLLAVGSDASSVQLYNLMTNQSRRTERSHNQWIPSVAFHPTIDIVASGSPDQTVRLWDGRTGQALKILQGSSQASLGVAFAPDGNTFLECNADEMVRIWRLDEGDCVKTLRGHTSTVNCVAVSPNGITAASGGADQTIRLWNIETGHCHSVLRGHTSLVTSLAFSPDGHLLASANLDHTIRLWDPHIGQHLRTVRVDQTRCTGVAFSPQGGLLASCGDDQIIHLWDPHTGQPLDRIEGLTDRQETIVFSPDGQRLACAGYDQNIYLWNIEAQQKMQVLTGHTDWIESVSFSPDGKTIASGSADHTIRLWDVQSGQVKYVIDAHSEKVSAVAFSPDGQRIVSCSLDETIHIWQANTGACLKTWVIPGPYDRMNIWGATGLTPVQRNVLKSLGAVEER